MSEQNLFMKERNKLELDFSWNSSGLNKNTNQDLMIKDGAYSPDQEEKSSTLRMLNSPIL